MTPPSGDQYPISAAGYRAVVTGAGATLRHLSRDGHDLVAGFAEDQMCSGGRGQVLAPWPNRVRDGRYSFADAALQLPLSEPARHNASHGLVRWTTWTPVEATSSAVTLGYRLAAQPGYPWSLDLTVTYAVGEDGLSVTTTATNRAELPAPFGCGAHPYLTTGSERVDDDVLSLPARTRLLTDPDRKLPTGTEPVAGTAHDFAAGRRLGDLVLDDAFTDLPDGFTVTLAGATRTVELWGDPAYRWVQVYTADDQPAAARRAVAVEPTTMPPDAFNSGTDLRVLAPGEEFRATWGIREVR